MRKLFLWLWVCLLTAPTTAAFAQGLDITRGQRGLVQTSILEHLFVSTAVGVAGAGDGGTVAAKDMTGKSAGITLGTITLTRTGTAGNSVAPPPYPARIQFAVHDVDNNSVITCTGGTIVGLDPYGVSISETVSGTIDETPATDPVITVNAYSDVIKVTFTGCLPASGTMTGDMVKAVVSDWIYVGQKIRSPRNILKICGHDFDASPAVNSWECYSGFAINTEKTWSSIFHARSNTIDMATLFASDTQLFGGALEHILIETFPFPVSY